MQEMHENEVKNGGWTNLLSRVRSCVGTDYEKVFQDARDHAVKSPMNGFFVRVSDQEKEMHRLFSAA